MIQRNTITHVEAGNRITQVLDQPKLGHPDTLPGKWRATDNVGQIAALTIFDYWSKDA
jgi:hypothetical protein